jgi:hypothetical protein
MVSVQYNNVGSGFGRGGNNEAFLPYRIIKDGAFRPPIVDQRDLMPLSRQPRNFTSINTSAEFIDYSKGIKPSEDALKHREVLNTLRTTPICASKGYNFKTGMDEPYDVVYHIDDKPQRIKQAQFDVGEGPDGYPGDNIGKNVIDGVTSSVPRQIEGFVENFIPTTQNISSFRDEINGVLEGSSGRVPIAKNDSTWQQHPQMQFKDPKNLQITTNANGNVTKDNVNRTERQRERNLPSYSIVTPKTFKGLHFNYLNGFQEQEKQICTIGMIHPKKQRESCEYVTPKTFKGLHINYLNGFKEQENQIRTLNPKKQRETYSYGNDGQGGGGGNKPMTIQMAMNREESKMKGGGVWSGQSNLSFGTKTIRNKNEGIKINY